MEIFLSSFRFWDSKVQLSGRGAAMTEDEGGEKNDLLCFEVEPASALHNKNDDFSISRPDFFPEVQFSRMKFC